MKRKDRERLARIEKLLKVLSTASTRQLYEHGKADTAIAKLGEQITTELKSLKLQAELRPRIDGKNDLVILLRHANERADRVTRAFEREAHMRAAERRLAAAQEALNRLLSTTPRYCTVDGCRRILPLSDRTVCSWHGGSFDLGTLTARMQLDTTEFDRIYKRLIKKLRRQRRSA